MGYWAKDGAYMHDEHDANVNVHEGVPRPNGIIEESDSEKYWKKVRQNQMERERLESQEIEDRKKTNERREREYEVAAIMRREVLEAYRKQSWFKRFVEKRKGNDPYSRQSEIYDEVLEQARTMRDSELNDIIRSGRTR